MIEKDKQLNPAVAASKEKTLDICKYLSDKKASSIVYIDVESKTSLCDYFVICSGRSSTQVKSMAEGVREGRWAVLDYEDVIVHIFNDEERDFYRLERLWEDGKNLTKYED